MDSWLNDRKTIEKSIRPYAHFDSRTNIANVRQYILKKLQNMDFIHLFIMRRIWISSKREKEK